MSDIERELRDHESGLKVLLIRRRYAAAADDVWDAITDPDRIRRWFLPLSGDLREGGRFSLEGNASGTILRCAKPSEIAVTWESPVGASNVVVRLIPDGDDTVLELEHSPVPAEIVTNVGETWGLGAGWELGLMSLGLYLAGTPMKMPPDMGELARMAAEISDIWAGVIARA
jgi:uncharacterized protein YndB with AHSA1/START domain